MFQNGLIFNGFLLRNNVWMLTMQFMILSEFTWKIKADLIQDWQIKKYYKHVWCGVSLGFKLARKRFKMVSCYIRSIDN